MIVQVGNGYLELNETIQVEKKVKLFDSISATEGDFSYSFSIPKTKNNVSLIDINTISDAGKPWNNKIIANILNDAGVVLYSGFIRIETDLPYDFNYSASFFSGNSNWMTELEFSLLDLRWNSFDVEPFTTPDFDKTSGVVFPLVDNGLLYYRNHAHFSSDEFIGYIYVKDVVNVLLASRGIKLNGDLLTDPNYNKLITTGGANKLAKIEVENRTAHPGKSSNQTVTTSYATATFTDVSDPFYNSPLGNWSTVNSRYTFDVELRDYEININLIYAVGESFYYTAVRIRKNGTTTLHEKVFKTRIVNQTYTYEQLSDTPSVGDYYEIQVKRSSWSTDRTMVAGSSITIKPTRFYKVFASTVIPDMTGINFLSNIFRMLNCIVVYDSVNKTITADLFDKNIALDPLDVSKFVTIKENNFEEFIAYSKSNLLVWEDQSNDLVTDYNEENDVPYAAGAISIENDFLEEQSNLVEMDFVAPFQRMYAELSLELPLTDFITGTETDQRSITSVSLDSGSGIDYAVFNYSGAALINCIVRISESTIEAYNGDYYAIFSGGTFNGYVEYLGNATAVMHVVEISPQNSNPVFLLNNPSQDITAISGLSEFYVGNLIPLTNIAVANFLNTDNYNGSLGFDYLKNIYFNRTEKLLNSGVKCIGVAYLPDKVYRDIDFLRPLRVNGVDFYPNKLTGYVSSEVECDIELIKI